MSSPLTPGLTGWMQCSPATNGAEPQLEKFESGLDTRAKLHHALAPNGACIATSPPYLNTDSIVGVILGTPRWSDPDTADIADEAGDSAALVHAYCKHGSALTKGLSGDYAFALLDPIKSTVLLGTDRLGRYPLYYLQTDDTLLFGSSANSVLTPLNLERKTQAQGVYNYIYFHMIPSPSSVFEGVKKLQAGSLVTIQGSDVTVSRHWQPVFQESSTLKQTDFHALLKEKLREAVKSSMPKQGKVGAFLSGGLDSSTVTGMLAEISEQSCDAYSIGFSADGYDEMEYARITANHFGARLHEYYVTPDDVVAALPKIATSYDEPFGNSSALPAYFCARMAADDGVDLLLAGDGGDEIFAGNERYAQQGVFEAYQNVPKWLRSGLLEPLVRNVPSWVPLAEKSRSYIAQANTPLPDRLQTYNFLHQYQAADIFQPEFLRGLDVNYPLELQQEVYRAPHSASQLNRMLFLDWQFTLADNDLRKVSHMCAVAGIGVAYPMLDDALVEFSLSIPSGMKMPGAKLRDFYKSALTGWLPDATISKKKQGFGLPFGVWMQEHKPLQELAYDNIIKLKNRAIFNDSFLDNAVELHRDGHAAYFGELIWILTVLELWMDKNG